MIPVIALMPKDLPPMPGVKLPTPTIEHTPMDCPVCARQCWIGPEQLRMFKSQKSVALCYFCIAKAGVGNHPVVSLNPDIDKVPKRIN